MTDHLTENARLRAALEKALNYIENTESELGITLDCGDAARAALATPAPDAPDLTDPVVVHYNMLRGTIAKPSVAQIIHLYGSAVFLELLYKRGLCKPTVTPATDAVQEAARDTDLLLDAYNGLLVLHRLLDKIGLQAGMKTTSDLADRIVTAHPEFPGRAALRAIAGDRT